jgi:GDP/UDP-N,N'-diacetylbacillosamine 2-epimerase (hydrolysing)
LLHVINPYGEGGASEKIVSTLKNMAIADIVKKGFYDMHISNDNGHK